MKRILPLLLIFLLALFLRVDNLGNHPPGLTWDEAGLGYNAYSILKTGKDEFGVPFPLIFKSFGDYKPGIYVYLIVPFIALFGLTELAVRLPSAIFGALAVIGVYLLVNEIFSREARPRVVFSTKWGEINLGHIAAVILAVMPWHLHFSRGGWEVNTFVTMLTFGAYLLLHSLNQKKFSPLWSVAIFTLAIFTYQAAKLLVPLVVITIALLDLAKTKAKVKDVFQSEKKLLPLYLVLFAVSLFYLYESATGPAGNRVARLSIFSYKPTPSQELIDTDNGNLYDVALYHSQADLTLRAIASRYLYHFSPELLFFENSTPREALPKMGLLYLFDAVFLIAGLFFLAREKEKKGVLLVLAFLLFAPLGASMTLSEFSVVRALFMTVPLAIIIALGVYYLFDKHKIVLAILLLAYIHNVWLGLDLYFKHSQNFLAPSFNYGYRQAVEAIKTIPAKKVYFTDVYGQPYIYYLFYTAYDPATYQKENNFISGGIDVGSVPSIGNVEFHQFSPSDIQNEKDILFIGSNGNIPDSFDPNIPQVIYYDRINLPDGTTPVFRVVKTAP